MTPELYRTIAPAATVATVRPVILVGSGNYRRRVSLLYRRRVVTVSGVQVTPELFIGLKDSVGVGLGGQGIHVLPGIQFQIELDRQDRLLGLADANAAQSPEHGIEVSVVVETLEADGPESTSGRTGV